MKRRIMVKWICSKQIEVDIADGALTDEEIEDAVDKAARHILPGGGNCRDNWEYEWMGKEPTAKGETANPPDDYWFDAAGYTVATNGYALITKDCPAKFVNDSIWRKVVEPTTQIIDLLSVDFASLPPHRGWFRNAFEGFKGYRVVGKTPVPGDSMGCAGYVLDDAGKFIALLMPASLDGIRDPSAYFQFNSDSDSN
jgi:hypothetical protein